jgi:hypothetical protein
VKVEFLFIPSPTPYIEIQRVNFTEIQEEFGEGRFWKKIKTPSEIRARLALNYNIPGHSSRVSLQPRGRPRTTVHTTRVGPGRSR